MQLKHFWNNVNLSDLPLGKQLRIKELFLILRLILLDSQDENDGFIIASETEILTWIEELKELVQAKRCLVLICDTLIQQVQFVLATTQRANKFPDAFESVDLLQAIEQYQKSPEPQQSTNFGAQVYHEHYLSTRIELLYRIGFYAKILAPNEAFNSITKVTQLTQDICNKVIQRVENNLGFQLTPVNTYEPFIWQCKNSYQRVKALLEIGVRSGLFPEEIDVDCPKISPINAQLVIDWMKENYGVELPFPEKNQLETKSILLAASKSNTLLKFIDKITAQLFSYLLLASLLGFPIFMTYQHLFNQPILTSSQYLLRQKLLENELLKQKTVKQSLPLKLKK